MIKVKKAGSQQKGFMPYVITYDASSDILKYIGKKGEEAVRPPLWITFYNVFLDFPWLGFVVGMEQMVRLFAEGLAKPIIVKGHYVGILMGLANRL